MSWEMHLDDKLLEELYKWIDNLPLTRPKKRIERDFQDGLLVAEIIHYYLPELVDLHNYSSANSLEHKKSNWGILNKKVLSNFGLDLSDVIITGLSNGKPGLIEVLLFNLRLKIDEELELQGKVLQTSLSSRHTSLSYLSTNNIKHKNVSRLDFEEVKQLYLEQEEQIEVLQAKLRRLEHVLQLKDMRIGELTQSFNNDQTNRTNRSKK